MKTCFIFVLTIALVYAKSDYEEIVQHLKDREDFRTVGYIPRPGSGVTIGIGIDLGQQTKNGLITKGVPMSVVKKVEKYIGLDTESKVKSANLKADSLKLTQTEAIQISKPIIDESINAVKPYAAKMDTKGLAVLVSLKHWVGYLSCTGKDCKLSTKKNKIDTNYVWDTIKSKDATNEMLKSAMIKIRDANKKGSVRYNRLKEEINYLG